MTPKLAVAALIMTAIITLPHAVRAAEFELRVSGSAGLRFSGHYALASADETPKSDSLVGSVPATYRWSGDAIRIKIAIPSHAGNLTLKLYRDGRLAGNAMAQGEGGTAMLSAGEIPGHWPQGYGGGGGNYGYGGGGGNYGYGGGGGNHGYGGGGGNYGYGGGGGSGG